MTTSVGRVQHRETFQQIAHAVDTQVRWNHGRASGRSPTPGLWAVEPHVARAGVGVRFEELLLIQADTAEWLDDDLPHHRA